MQMQEQFLSFALQASFVICGTLPGCIPSHLTEISPVPPTQDLKWVGLLAPLDAPHHLRKYENLPYREGAAMKEASTATALAVCFD